MLVFGTLTERQRGRSNPKKQVTLAYLFIGSQKNSS